MKKSLPSFFTSFGLIAGCISILLSVSHKNLMLAGYFIIIAAAFDFIDGFVARMLNSITEFGKQLDSLSDVVSFGVAPSMILYQLLEQSYVKSSPGSDFDYTNPTTVQSVVMFCAFLVAVFSALRLAKFNLDPEQKKNFKGLAVPANALFITGLGFAADQSVFASNIVLNRWLLLVVVAISCYLLVSNISMFSLKFSNYSFGKNIIRYVFLLFSVILLLVFGLPGFTLVIILYVILSVINNWFVHME